MTKRLTIPEQHVALLLDNDLAAELRSLCHQLRNADKKLTLEIGHREIAGDVLLAMLDAESRA